MTESEVTNKLPRYAFDYSRLEKGDVIPVEQIEHVIEASRKTSDYQLELMKFKNWLEKRLLEQGKQFVICQHEFGLKILKDHEAVEYLANSYRRHIEAALTVNRKNQTHIDTNNLSEKQLQEYENELYKQSFISGSILGARKQIKLMQKGGKTRKLNH